MVGFNRRFAPVLGQLRAAFGPARRASATQYLVNAGRLEANSWYLDRELAGSRFAGEGGHFIDTLSWWTESLPAEVYAARGARADDVQAVVRFSSGCTGVISYLTGGNARFPKESLDVVGHGRNARLDDYRQAAVWSGRRRQRLRSRESGKGQREQVARFVEACRTGGPMPISLDSLLATTRATLAVGASLASGRPEPV
jgi:predicted dehydrogenase